MNPVEDRTDLVRVALGKAPPDLVVEGGTLVNVNTRETHRADIIIKGQRVAAVEDVVPPAVPEDPHLGGVDKDPSLRRFSKFTQRPPC